MLIAHRIALDPNNAQTTHLARAAGTARFAGKIMSATVSRVADRWWVSIAVNTQDDSHLPQAENEPQDKSQVHGEFRHSQSAPEWIQAVLKIALR